MGLYRIADIIVEMHPRFPLLAERAKPYMIDSGTPAIVLSSCGDDPFTEYSETAKVMYTAFLRFDAFFLHASAVELDGKAYLFSAPSGTGKSTHTAFWRQELGANVINDDKPIVRMIDGVFYACGTPFSGKKDLSRNVCVPVGGIASLERASENGGCRLDTHKALWMLLNQTLRPKDITEYERLLVLLERAVTSIPFYTIRCVNDPSAAYAARHLMNRE